MSEKKNQDGFIVIKFVLKLPKQIACTGHICLVSVEACLNVACCYEAGGQTERQFLSHVHLRNYVPTFQFWKHPLYEKQ